VDTSGWESDGRFDDLPNFDYEPQYVEVDDTRIAYVEEGDGEETFLCLHGEPTWSFLHRKMLPVLATRGRAIAPDLPGFGRSDKWSEPDDYTYRRLYDAVEGFVEALELTNVTLVCQDWGGCLTDLDDDVLAGYAAPLPDEEHLAGLRALPGAVPTEPDHPAAEPLRETRETLGDWEKPAFVLFADGDPITRESRVDLRELLPTAADQPDVWIEDAGHFLQEDAGARVAERIVAFVDRT